MAEGRRNAQQEVRTDKQTTEPKILASRERCRRWRTAVQLKEQREIRENRSRFERKEGEIINLRKQH